MTVYLDNAATTLRKPESVYRAMEEALRHGSVNAGRGSYALAQEAERQITATKDLLKRIVKAEQAAEVVFTASATLAFNAIIGGMDWQQEDVVYVTPYEHNAVMRTLHGYQKQYGFQITELPLESGTLAIDLQKTEYLFAKTPPTHLFLNMISNVTGYVLPAAELCRRAHSYGCITILDGAQALGTLPVSMKELDADFLVFAGHKALCGPFGIGGYINAYRRKLKHFFLGGTGSASLNLEMPEETEGFEPGSPNIVAIRGLQAALEDLMDGEQPRGTEETVDVAERQNAERQKDVEEWQNAEVLQNEKRLLQFWREEQSRISYLKKQLLTLDGLQLYAAPTEQTQAGILSINLEGYKAQELGRILDEDYNIAVRTGYHCAPLIHKHLQDEGYVGTVRISIGRFTEEEELRRVVEVLRELAEE